MATKNWMASALPADDGTDAPVAGGNWLASGLGDDGLDESARTIARQQLAVLAPQIDELGERIQAAGSALAAPGRMPRTASSILMSATSSRKKRTMPLVDLAALDRLRRRGVFQSM